MKKAWTCSWETVEQIEMKTVQMKQWIFDGQLRRGEIGEPVELVAQIVQDSPIRLNCWYKAWLANVLMESRHANWTFSFYATSGQVIFGLITKHSLTSGGLYLWCKSACRQHGQTLFCWFFLDLIKAFNAGFTSVTFMLSI